MFTPNDVERFVDLNSKASIAMGSASFLTLMTARIPLRSDSSAMSLMPISKPFFSSLNFRILSSKADLLT